MTQTTELAEKHYLDGLVSYSDAQDLPRHQRAERTALAQRAAEQFRQAVEADPTHVLAWTALGDIALNYLGDVEEALQAFKTCSNLEPDNDFPNCMLGMALLATRRREEAFEQFDKAIQGFQSVLEPGTRNPHYASWISEKLIEAGTYCCFHGAPEKALELYASPVQMEFNPEDYPAKWSYEHGSKVVFNVRKKAYCRIGIALLMLGREAEASQHLEAASEIATEDLSFFEDLGYAYKQLGRMPKAIQAFEMCEGIWEGLGINTADIVYELEQLQPQRKRPSRRIPPPNAETEERFSRAANLFQEEKYKEAAGELILAVKSARGRFPDAHWLLGHVYDLLEEYEEAMRSYEAAIKADSHHANSLKDVALLQANIATWAKKNNPMVWVKMQQRAEKSVKRIIDTYQSVLRQYAGDPGEWVAWTNWMLEVAGELEQFDEAIKLKSAHLYQAVANMPLEQYNIDPEFGQYLQEVRATAERHVVLAQERGILPKKRFGFF